MRVGAGVRAGPHLLDHGIARGEVLVGDVSRVDDRLGREEAQALDGVALLVAQVDLALGLGLGLGLE